MKKKPAIYDLLKVMARLRSPKGCPWDREQDHKSLRWHAVEEVYELMDSIEAGDDNEILEELINGASTRNFLSLDCMRATISGTRWRSVVTRWLYDQREMMSKD